MKHLFKRAAAAAAASLLLLTGCSTASRESSTEVVPEPAIPEFSIPENILGEPSDLLPDIKIDKYAVPEGEGMEFVKKLKLGWSLGNTFDASNVGNISAADELRYEKAWCGNITTIENIAAIKAAGFETIRIPVSWHNHVDENFTISAPWMARVKEVVDWCRACDLYVIINIHHDTDEQFYYPDSAHLEASKTYVQTIWKQIAETFKDYDEHLIMETLNEPRLVGSKYEWWIDKNNAECQDAIACINTLNQLAVDTIRAAGGSNAERYIMCPGYAASPDGAMNDGFVLPTDPANRIILSVHAYTPYNFALNKTGTNEWSLDASGDTGEITNFLDNLYGKFICAGVPVVIGEFGAMNKDNLEDRVNWAAFYTAAARARGISCCWWDNNAFAGSGENFGLLYRGNSVFSFPEVVQALVKGAEYQ